LEAVRTFKITNYSNSKMGQ